MRYDKANPNLSLGFSETMMRESRKPGGLIRPVFSDEGGIAPIMEERTNEVLFVFYGMFLPLLSPPAPAAAASASSSAFDFISCTA